MKTIDDFRGFDREIKFSATGGHATGGGAPLTNCVVEIADDVVETDTVQDDRRPVLSLRFYYKPIYSHRMAEESAKAGRPLEVENTTTGRELNLGLEMAQSLIEQIQAKWPQF